MCVKLLQLQHKRATYILFEFKSSLKRESETRVNEAKSVGEENVKFLFLGLFRINFTPAFSRFSTSKSQSCWGPNQCWEQVRKPYTCTLPMRLAKACPSENGKFPICCGKPPWTRRFFLFDIFYLFSLMVFNKRS